MKKLFTLILCVVLLHESGFATDYYCDPASGSMSNPGTSASPWSTLEAVFAAGKTFSAGDNIYLRNGYHGFPVITGNNSGYVTIQPQAGQSPGLKMLLVQNASKWVISGLTISPELNGQYFNSETNIVELKSSASYITIQNCFIYGALSLTGWSFTDIQTK